MGLTQDFAGSIEPDDPAWLRADRVTKKRYYSAAGPIVLDELGKQLGKGIGATGRTMKPRIQAVLPDGADGPVMIPHYLASRATTLADWAATDHGLKLFWHAGTGHRSHRKARSKGQKAAPFGTILGYHADGLVPHAPVRDVRLSPARIANVKRRLAQVWQGMLRTGAYREDRGRLPTPPTAPTPPTPASGQRVDQPHEVPPGTHPQPHPTPAPKAPQAPKFKPGEFNPPPTPYVPGEHPTPTHPIPVFTKLPKGRIKGPIFIVPGGGGAKGKAPVPKPGPKPKLPPRKAPVPKPPQPKRVPAPEPVMAQPLPNPFFAHQTPIESATAWAASKGVEVRIDPAMIAKYYTPEDARQVLAWYTAKRDAIYINADHAYWKAPAEYNAKRRDKEWFSSAHPHHVIHHEVGHALHARAIGLSEFGDRDDRFTRTEDVATARKVSKYAAENTAEFVAETYAARVAGRRLDDDVLKLYDRLGGPNVQARSDSPVLRVQALPRPNG